MRITGGAVCGRRLIGPKGRFLRPTTDMVREALFQVLTVRLEIPWESCLVLDIFAGTGALGIEALSREARGAVFVDSCRSSVALIMQNLKLCGLSTRASVIRSDIRTGSRSLKAILRQGPFELIFADPPYSQGLGEQALNLIAKTGALAPGGWMIVEGFKGEGLPHRVRPCETRGKGYDTISPLQLVDARKYGQTILWFYSPIRCDH